MVDIKEAPIHRHSDTEVFACMKAHVAIVLFQLEGVVMSVAIKHLTNHNNIASMFRGTDWIVLRQ